MSKLCAPIRDEKIKELTEKVDVIDTFKGILEVLTILLNAIKHSLQFLLSVYNIIRCVLDIGSDGIRYGKFHH